MTVIAASSIDWHVEWHGPPACRVLCLVHGFAGSLHTWDVLMPELSAHFRLLLVDSARSRQNAAAARRRTESDGWARRSGS